MMGWKSEARIDAAARRAAGALTRRTSLLALGGAVLAASAATPLAAEGGTGGKGDNGGYAGKKAKKACKRQGEQCRRLVQSICNGEGEQACLADQLPCCAFFARCKAGPGFACFTDSD